jgi:hypothetical protein
MNASNAQDEQHGRRGSEDQERDKTVYRYLLTLTDLELNGSPAKPNESSIAKQWGMEDNRIFIRRVLRSVLHHEYYSKEKKQTVPGLTLGKLVGILSALQKYWMGKHTPYLDDQFPPILSRSDKLKALRLFFQLSVEERESLELAVHPGEALLRQLVEDATDPIKGLGNEEIARLYKAFLRQHQLSVRMGSESHLSLSKNTIGDFIKGIVTQLTAQHFEGLEESRKTNRINDLVEKVQREISRIEFQSGVKQAEFFLVKSRDQPSFEYLTPSFVQRLTQSVVENEIITEELPIYLKYFEIERVRPLPLYVKRNNEAIGLLNRFLLESDEDEDRINGLDRQFAYRVKVHFYIKLPDDYEVKFPDITLVSQISGNNRLNFSEVITGVGSPISHIISAINRILLWDIPALKDYLPIADEVLNNDEVVGGTNHSPVWSHSVVRLYKNVDIAAAIEKNTPCDQMVEAQEVAYGEFCGFDLIEVAVKAALNARLKLIKQTGINPKQYLRQLCHHIEELNALERAKQCLNFHPFSLRAMEGELERTIFNQQYRIRKKDFNFEEIDPGKCWSVVAIDAHLEIAEANLKEGLYRVAKKYLDAIAPYFTDEYRDLLGNLTFAKYHLCRFRYYYLTDLEDSDHSYPDRYKVIRDAEDELEKAETCLHNRLKKYENLDELPQSNFHPQFYLLSRIYAHRAKLHIFFSPYTRQPDSWSSLLEPVRLLEKARIYAAQDGDAVLYAQWSAYQSWCYLMVAYRGSQHQSFPAGFTREQCIEWADGLIKHALICYSSRGKTCYQQIKDNGGKITEFFYQRQQNLESAHSSTQTRPVTVNKYYEYYGKTFVQVVPLIQELKKDDEQSYDPSKHVVNLDISLLKQIGKDDSHSVYLFGMHSSIILFAMGMLEVCQEQVQGEVLIEAIQTKALRMFTYCWAIASDGTQRRSKEKFTDRDVDMDEDAIILDRAFAQKGKSGDYLLQSLYPHRLTQFADLGKIFVVVCKLLLIVASESIQTYYNSKQSWKTVDSAIQSELNDISQLIAELRTNNQFPTPDILGQKRYNGHLAEQYKNFDLYIAQFTEQLKAKKLQSINIIDVRNRMITDVFNIIGGITIK